MKRLFLFSLLLVSGVQASPALFAEKYHPAPPVVQEMSHVVYYRPAPAERAAKQVGINVYVDGEFQSSLLPGGYTRFCLSPGKHTLGARAAAGSQYPGKVTERYSAELKPGYTYFLRASDSDEALPQTVQRSEAERQLQGLKRQIHLLNRASGVIPCVYDTDRVQAVQRYVIERDELFMPDSGELSEAGRQAIAELAVMLRQNLSRINEVQIIVRPVSQAEPSGLGLQQAEQLQEQLMRDAIPRDRIKLVPGTDATACDSRCLSEQHINVYAR
ncbi:hypothetical protein [Pantoea sp. Pa-EAmG]|uniref:hypothetical protein n=1 Tax=Pantoea sp. Pa-EAmG TaxID=3043311 RepID=UPI0024AF40B8|nr:hypothetical protein [Pantoea sp. Pa-EAmG]MDI6958271.1 hypothetical protein [Pantoea sp. Pa-EAmG]